MANGERSKNGIYLQGDEDDYIHNHTLSPQHLMPLEEEDNDGAILMLQGAQRGELHLCENAAQYCVAPGNVYVHCKESHQRFKGAQRLKFINKNMLECSHHRYSSSGECGGGGRQLTFI